MDDNGNKTAKEVLKMIEDAKQTQKQQPQVCPHCGRCPTCGHSHWPQPQQPYWPRPYWYYAPTTPYVEWIVSSNG